MVIGLGGLNTKARAKMQEFNHYLLNSNPPKVKTNAEDAVVSRAPELRQLNENIDKATNTWGNATLQLESAIRKYNSAQTTLGNALEHLVDMYSLVPAYAKGSAVRETYRWFIWLGRYNILWELILCSTHFMDSHSTNVLLENCET